MLTTRDGAAVEPGTPLYWLEPGTTRVYEAETWTRDEAMQRWSSPGHAILSALDQAASLELRAGDDMDEARRRLFKHRDFQGECRLSLVAPGVTRVPPTDRPEAN